MKRKVVRVAGATFLRSVGRFAVVYGKACPPDELAHSVSVTELEDILGIDFERDVSVGTAIPDSVFTKDGSLFAIDGVAAGENLASKFKSMPAGIWELTLTRPIRNLTGGTLTVSVKDREGNLTEIVRRFSVK